jgi:transposase
VDRGRPGAKHHLIVDRSGVPLAVRTGPANQHDSMMFETLLDAIPSLPGAQAGHPRRRPSKLHADKGYDYAKCRRACTARHIKHRLARCGIHSSKRLGRHRWVVERTFAWLAKYRRLAIRYERLADVHRALLTLGCVMVCWNYLQPL